MNGGLPHDTGALTLNPAGQFMVVQSGVVQPPVMYPFEMPLWQGDALQFSIPLFSASDTGSLAVHVQGLYYGLGG